MRWIILAGLIVTSSAAFSKTRFQAYEGKNAVSEGSGGTKITTNGVDFWTSGSPPRRFQIIGIFIDTRGTGAFAGNAVGAKSIAAKVRDVGGDALIVMDQSSRVAGVYNSGSATSAGSTAWGSVISIPIERATTTLVAIKYLSPD